MAMVPHPRFCLCCEPPSPRAPADIYNRPGLSALAYRLGTFATFREAMLEDIAKQTELAALATRESDDYAITLIELFAAVGDVLTFYNERLVNELYLRTARQRESLLHLVRLIGYRLRPGLAANALLAFTLDDGARTRIRAGLKVMSIPGQDERPQTFETLEQLLADFRLNALPAYAPPVPFNAFHHGCSEAPMDARPEPLGQGDHILVFGFLSIEEKTIAALEQARDGERLRFSPAIQAQTFCPGVARAVKLKRRLRFFGHNAPDSYQVYDTDPAIPPSQRWKTVHAGDPGYDMGFSAADAIYPLDARYDALTPGASLLVDAGPSADPRLLTAVVETTEDQPVHFGQLQDTVTHVRLTQTIRGRPAVLAVAGTVHGFARSGIGRVLARTQASPRWQALGNVIASDDLSVVAVAGANAHLFARDAVGRLRGNLWSGGSWTGWSDFGGILTSAPAAVEVASGQILVCVRGLDFGLWVIQVSPVLINWLPLHGRLTSAPAAVSWGGPRVDVFARGPERALWRITQDGVSWTTWEQLGGTLASAPAVATTAAHRLDVVALDDDGALIHRRWTGTDWTDWLHLGGKGKDAPTVVATGPDRVEVFLRGADDQLWQIARSGVTWSAWVPLGGALTSAPSVSRAGGQLHVVARDAEGALIDRSWTGTFWTPWARVGGGLGVIPDRRTTRLYEIATPDITFRAYDYAQTISGGRVAVRLADAPGLEGLDKGRRILLDDATSRHPATVTRTERLASTPGNPPDHLLIDYNPPLPKPFRTTALQGNIARASHGETQPDEPLGNGDATQAFSTYRLRRLPLTYLQSETKIEGAAELEIRINGELWQEVPSLYGRRPTERVYTARQTDNGETEITLGDGRTGARAPTGAMNVVAHYRTGLGLEGQMQADQLAIPLERPVGLRSVTNPLPADGGADPEPRDQARAAAPTTVRTFGRAVSLQDFEWLATTSGLVARAHATWVWQKLEKAVHVTVAAAGGAWLSTDSLKALYAALTAARDPNRPLLLANLVRVPIVVRAKLLRQVAFKADDVLAAARQTLTAHFAFEVMPLGRAVHASDIYAVLQGVRGVYAVDLDLLHLKGHTDLTADERAVRAVTTEAVQAHIRIFPARPTPADLTLIDRFARASFTGSVPPAVLAAEQAYIEDPVADVDLTVVEAF